MSSEYVKPLPNGDYEVKLGAGILPIIIDAATRQWYQSLSYQGGTITPPNAESVEQINRIFDAVAAINKYEFEQ